MGFLTPIDCERILAEARGHRDLSPEEWKDLFGNYISVKRTMKNRETGYVLKTTSWQRSEFKDFLKWSLGAGYEKGKVLMPRNPYVFPDERLVLDEEFNAAPPHVYATFRLERMFAIWLAPCPGEALVYYDEFYWTSVAGAKRSGIGIAGLNGRGRKVARKRRKAPQNKIKAFGKSKTSAEWARDPRAVVSDKTIKKRIASGWSAESAITTPPRPAGRPRS